MDFSIFSEISDPFYKNSDLGRFLRSLEGFKSSGKLVGSISTTPGTYWSPWCRVMTKNPGGIFLPSTISKQRQKKQRLFQCELTYTEEKVPP